MNLFSDLRGTVIAALDQMTAEGLLPEGLDYANVAVEPPRDPLHGDMATNAAMVLAKPARMKPRDIAEKLAEKLAEREMQVLKGLTEGKSNKEIARDLELQEVTIKLHVKTLCRKLDARNRTDAAMIARSAGFI